MDSFTENLLSRARERQKLLENFNGDSADAKKHLSQPELHTRSPVKTVSQNKKNNSEDNVRVEVQIEEEDHDESPAKKTENGLRKDAKNRLNRLGKLYEGGEDANISSPIHQTKSKFAVDEAERVVKPSEKGKRGLSKLADLANTINQYEDDLSHVQVAKSTKKTPPKKSKKSPAPQPPKPPSSPLKKQEDQNFKLDKKVLDCLESQGFTRTESSTRLIYKYEKENLSTDPKKTPEPSRPISRTPAIADKAALFESSPNKTKDPALLSLSERKALFEKNKGTPLIPKAPFAMATPVKSTSVAAKPPAPPTPKETKEIVPPKSVGIANKVAALFENKSTISQEQIERNTQEQRKKEMDLLLNRFKQPVEAIIEETSYNDEDATEETAMIAEKPPKVISKEERRSSGNKRCSKADSPKVAAVLSDVKRIKVSPQKAGRLYPSLTDIESMTETENETRSPTPNESSFEHSIAESDDANTSFGRDILQVVCSNQKVQKDQILDESTSDNMSDVLDDLDDYIDEALAYKGNNDGPTPPKQGRKSPIEPSHSFNYKSFQEVKQPDFKSPNKKTRPSIDKPSDSPTYVVDGDNVLPLTHTVSFYRKQQSQNSTTPVRQISRQVVVEESPEKPSEEQTLIVAKINELKNEVSMQELIISQTSQALNLCQSTLEFTGSTEQVEAEKVLLVATHRRQAAMHERQRLEVEKTLRPLRKGSHLPSQKGTLTLSKIVLPLKQKYVTALAAAGGKGHHVVCLVKCGAQVVPTQLVSTIASDSKNPELELSIPGVVKLKDVYSDFTVTFEVYCLQAQEEILPHEIKYHIKKSNVKLTPKKSKQDSRLMRPIKESPAGPQVVRSPTFALMGYVVLAMPSAINKKVWSLNNTPSMSPLEGTVEMCISCEMSLSVEHRGFLTMFEDVSGFGAWHRRWCLLRDDTLSYWKYPDDEKKTPPINSISLRESVTRHVGPVSRDICARLHTFLIEIERDAFPHDKDSLVTIRKGPKTIIRHLLSADTKEERLEWCNKFNTALSVLK